MCDKWKKILEKEIENRTVEIQIYSDNKSYKIITTQLEDVMTESYTDRGSLVIGIPINVGSKIEDDTVTLENMVESLVELGFSHDSATDVFDEINRVI